MKTIKTLYFGMFEEKTGVASETWQVNRNEISIADFEKLLSEKYPFFEQFSYQIAVNQQINTDKNQFLSENDEIAILPPFAGG